MNDKYKGAMQASLRPSRRVAAFIASAALLTDGVMIATPLPDWMQGLLVTWVCAGALWALRSASRPRLIAIDCAGQVAVDGRAGVVREGSFVAPCFTVVRWRPAGAWLDRTLLVAPDALPEADFRHLRVIVRWGQVLYSEPTAPEASSP